MTLGKLIERCYYTYRFRCLPGNEVTLCDVIPFPEIDFNETHAELCKRSKDFVAAYTHQSEQFVSKEEVDQQHRQAYIKFYGGDTGFDEHSRCFFGINPKELEGLADYLRFLISEFVRISGLDAKEVFVKIATERSLEQALAAMQGMMGLGTPAGSNTPAAPNATNETQYISLSECFQSLPAANVKTLREGSLLNIAGQPTFWSENKHKFPQHLQEEIEETAKKLGNTKK